MIEIDGSQGEGGGQIVRTSVALSVVTGTPIRIDHIRAKRDKPGLRRQHLTAVSAAASLCDASFDATKVGASSLMFQPKAVRGGQYHFDIGTAGSTTLVLQTILPGLMLCGEPSSVVLEGGTHNPGAPPFDFLAKAYLPLVRRMGPRVEAKLERPGFYPQGGGRLALDIKPSHYLTGFEMLSRGAVQERRCRAILANLPDHITERESNWVASKPEWDPAKCTTERWDHARGPGNIVLIEIASEHITEVFSAFGQRGVRAEQVAETVSKEAEDYIAANVPVGTHLADQLLLPFSLAANAGSGGIFRTQSLSFHSQTHMQVLRRFLDVRFEVQSLDNGSTQVSVQPARSGEKARPF